METASQVKRSWQARKAWVTRWENKIEKHERLKAQWPDDFLEKNSHLLPDRSEKELRDKLIQQRTQNNRWLKEKREEEFNQVLPGADDE